MIPQRGRAPQAPAPFMGGGRRPPLISVGSCPGCQGVRSFGFLLCLFLYIIRPQWSRSEVLCPFGLPRVSRSEGFLYLFLYFSCTFSRPWSCTRFCIFPVFSGSRGFIEPSSPEKLQDNPPLRKVSPSSNATPHFTAPHMTLQAPR